MAKLNHYRDNIRNKNILEREREKDNNYWEKKELFKASNKSPEDFMKIVEENKEHMKKLDDLIRSLIKRRQIP